MTDRSNESAEVQSGKPLSLFEVTYRSVAEVARKNRDDSKKAASLKVPPQHG